MLAYMLSFTLLMVMLQKRVVLKEDIKRVEKMIHVVVSLCVKSIRTEARIAGFSTVFSKVPVLQWVIFTSPSKRFHRGTSCNHTKVWAALKQKVENS